MPARMARAGAHGAGAIIGSVFRYRRRDALEALRLAFPEKTRAELRRIVRRMYANLALNAVEMLRIEKEAEQYRRGAIAWSGRDYLDRALQERKGALLLSAHTGNWELCGTLLPAVGYPANIVAKNIKNRGLNERIVRLRRQFGLTVLPARGSYRACLRALKRNDILVFVLDQNMTRNEGVFVDFFGRPACTTPGLAHLAAVSGAPVLPLFAERLDDSRHCLHVGPPLAPPRDRGEAALTEATQRYTRVIEDFVRARPEQWIWIHRRWKTRPLPAAAPASPAPSPGPQKEIEP